MMHLAAAFDRLVYHVHCKDVRATVLGLSLQIQSQGVWDCR